MGDPAKPPISIASKRDPIIDKSMHIAHHFEAYSLNSKKIMTFIAKNIIGTEEIKDFGVVLDFSPRVFWPMSGSRPLLIAGKLSNETPTFEKY